MAYVNDKLHLILVLTDETEIDAGYVGVSTGDDTKPDPEVPATYTVTFEDWNGTVLKTETVESGKAATAPANPGRTGYIFNGWDKAFTNVSADLTVTATYTQITGPAIIVNSVEATAGDTIEVTLTMVNNPGVLGITLSVGYDENAMALTTVTKGDALGEMTFTKPKALANGCKLLWDAEEVLPEDATNGTMVTLTFRISDSTAAGNYVLSLTVNGDIIDNDLSPVNVQIVNGTVTVK